MEGWLDFGKYDEITNNQGMRAEAAKASKNFAAQKLSETESIATGGAKSRRHRQVN
jgi:hypothetical protein